MFAALGLITTGLFFALFAATFERIVLTKTKLPLYQFSNAYYCLSLALLTWGLAAGFGEEHFLRFSVIAGDGLLLAGTIFLASILVPQKWQSDFYFITAAIASFLIAARAELIPPQPYLKDGLLFFNTQTPVIIGIGLALALVWLPVSAYVAKLITTAIKQQHLSTMFTTIYTAATISSLIFISTKDPLIMIASFMAITVSFVLLLSSNILVYSLTKGKRHAK